MQYRLELPLPGGKRGVVVDLERGTMTNPYEPRELCPLEIGEATDAGMRLKTRVGRTEYLLEGPASEAGYRLTLTTRETIPLEPGTRISGASGGLAGEYLVGVYSPGGVKENHFVVEETPQGYGGEMYGLVDQKSLDFMKQMMAGGPGGPGEPGGPPPGGPAMEPMPLPKLGDRTDVNVFTSVTGDPGDFTVTTVTGMGSEFRFTGCIRGDEIHLTLHVTDVSQGIRAEKI